IAIQIVMYLKAVWAQGTALVGIASGNLEQFYMYLSTVLIVTAITVAMYFYLKHTKHGYEISVVGEGFNTAKYAGINIKKVIIRTLVLSGAICGLTGFLILCGQRIANGLTEDIVGGIGFTAIIVAWLAKFNPAYMSLTALFVVFIQRGASNLNSVNTAFGQIIIGILFFFVIGCEFFLQYQIKMRKKNKGGETK
ncbi:MAG: ABC transporter permease, partial [Elusimicrobiaceae bacterium]|nr:ABC transporter permease [Elusimicrobiaceae bacterium]